jgi:hypothetical protein
VVCGVTIHLVITRAANGTPKAKSPFPLVVFRLSSHRLSRLLSTRRFLFLSSDIRCSLDLPAGRRVFYQDPPQPLVAPINGAKKCIEDTCCLSQPLAELSGLCRLFRLSQRRKSIGVRFVI